MIHICLIGNDMFYIGNDTFYIGNDMFYIGNDMFYIGNECRKVNFPQLLWRICYGIYM